MQKTKEMCVTALFTALICAGAFIKIPTPLLPVTFQSLFVTLAGLLLGGKKGALSVGVYVFIGLLGIPVFTEGGGLSYILKPTFGYLLGFILCAFISGKIAENCREITKDKEPEEAKSYLLSEINGAIQKIEECDRAGLIESEEYKKFMEEIE